MSKITTIFDLIVTRLEAVFPDHARLPHSAFLERNPGFFLRQGFGVHFGPGLNTDRQIGCNTSTERNFLVSLTREDVSTELDPVTSATNHKVLMEDLKLLMDDFEQETSFPLIYRSDGGIIPIFEGDENFIFLESVISVEYFEIIP